MIDAIDEMWKATGGPEKTRVNGRPSRQISESLRTLRLRPAITNSRCSHWQNHLDNICRERA